MPVAPPTCLLIIKGKSGLCPNTKIKVGPCQGLIVKAWQKDRVTIEIIKFLWILLGVSSCLHDGVWMFTLNLLIWHVSTCIERDFINNYYIAYRVRVWICKTVLYRCWKYFLWTNSRLPGLRISTTSLKILQQVANRVVIRYISNHQITMTLKSLLLATYPCFCSSLVWP